MADYPGAMVKIVPNLALVFELFEPVASSFVSMTVELDFFDPLLMLSGSTIVDL